MLYIYYNSNIYDSRFTTALQTAIIIYLFQLHYKFNNYKFNSHVPDYRKKTKELVNEKCNKMESKRKKLQRSQAKEKSCALELKRTHNDLQQLTKVRTFRITVA